VTAHATYSPLVRCQFAARLTVTCGFHAVWKILHHLLVSAIGPRVRSAEPWKFYGRGGCEYPAG
jgi:hypothetical protein